jgi:hypothetical protein
MADYNDRQPITVHDGTNERGLIAANALYLYLTDGTETASVNASNQLEVAVGNTVTISDGGGSITVDGTVAATQSGTWNITTVTTLTGITNDVNIADGGNSITVDAANLDIRDLTNASDSVLIYSNTAKDGSGTNYVPIVTSDGILRVDIASGSSGRTEYSDGAASAAHVGAVVMGSDGANLQTLHTDSLGDLQVDVIGPLPTGTNSIGNIGTVTTLTGITNDVNIADGGNSITVDGTVAATQSGTWNIATVTALTGISNDVNIADGGNVISIDDAGTTVSIDDGAGSITVDGAVTVSATNLDIRDLTSASDSVEVLQDTHDDLNVNANLQVSDTDVSTANPVPVYQVNAISTNEKDDYTTSSALGIGASVTHTYTVPALKTWSLDKIYASGSGALKYEIKAGVAASETTRYVGYTSAVNKQGLFDINGKIEVTAAQTVLVVITNRAFGAQDVHSTILANEL